MVYTRLYFIAVPTETGAAYALRHRVQLLWQLRETRRVGPPANPGCFYARAAWLLLAAARAA